MRLIIFDTETTGIDPARGDRIVEIGAVEMIDGSLTGREFHCYINPERDMPEEAFRVHRISADFLADKPKFADPAVGPAFLTFCTGASLVAHNARFDMGFLRAECDRAGLATEDWTVIDTVAMARKLFPGAPASLDALANRFELDLTARKRDGHGALLDARLLARIYVELTGGAQAGFAFAGSAGFAGQADAARQPTPQRRGPRPILLTDAEAAAHAALCAEIKSTLWADYLPPEAPPSGPRS